MTQGEGQAAKEAGSGRLETFWQHYRYHIAFVLLCALALLTHYNAVFVIVAWYLWWGGWSLLQPDRWRQVATVFVSGLAMTVLILPVAPIALRQIPGYANPNLRIPTLIEYFSENARAYLGGYAFNSTLLGGNANLWLILALLMLGCGLILSLVLSVRRPAPDRLTDLTLSARLVARWAGSILHRCSGPRCVQRTLRQLCYPGALRPGRRVPGRAGRDLAAAAGAGPCLAARGHASRSPGRCGR